MAIEIAQKIIIKRVSSQITFNIIDNNNLKIIQDILKKICLEIGQDVVYLILQEILSYSYIYKSRRCNNPTIEIFTEVYFFYKKLKVAIIKKYNLFNIIIIIIILNTLYCNFKVISISILETGDKTIKEIYSIIQSKETKYKAK